MYTILMNADKSLITSVKTTLYQREKLADKIQFLLPRNYEDIQIKDCTILLKYVDQGNVAHAEKLSIDDELYKDRIRCVMNVDTNLTRFAGDITIHLDFLKLNSDNGIYENALSSGETIITISPLSDYFAYCADESLDIISKNTLEMEALRKACSTLLESEESQVDDLMLTDNLLQVSANGTPVGQGVKLSSSGLVSEDGIPVVDFGTDNSENDVPNDDNTDDNRDVVEF